MPYVETHPQNRQKSAYLYHFLNISPSPICGSRSPPRVIHPKENSIRLILSREFRRTPRIELRSRHNGLSNWGLSTGLALRVEEPRPLESRDCFLWHASGSQMQYAILVKVTVSGSSDIV
ncbi:hypothetical protein CEXT_387511 [Caerostris extrusa]|uniref:Uncharacterized protein n=1 Tax=Caerostris extrusa TaxID=172846 RepID=A0AAV4P2W7_CAEEX|nr:hypothetical protein CEXT_387511 [Caerostris extrusa]